MTEYAEFHGFTHELIDYSVLDDDLVPCKACDGTGQVIAWFTNDHVVYENCQCTRRRPCDPLCRCSGGPL